MQITCPTSNPHRDLVATLYSAVDNLNAKAIGKLVTDDVRFRLGNFDELCGKQAVIDANNAFFGTISAMRHTIDDIGSEGKTVYCTGSVHYTRQDNSELSLPFATRLKLDSGRIADYRVYVDVSPL
ncbi:nuclear transport factor 2 family protein [Roseibium sp. Sym1]|uniref:nuclear transport factor 2 family protein n=1 Tax=Roseibium sp. Sym1 TaxID=3016006 RepID=UPI0022B5D416|nr:nuclear transport factor 2 family protein [Roseibium sp. Sym1]